ncbi:MAG TPA: hypothetical protein VK358_04850, partial [Longimicrobium sp.]|nr:hypothetical protein [Longimicrobium sp.]
MYRHCIFCSANLESNEALERFPVGRSVAFDAEKGRLWAVCQRCARWNLAPLEERWEAVEDAERLFRDTRLRAQNQNIGLAKTHDGTRLVRVGDALAGELAAWRYGWTLWARRRRYRLVAGGGALAMGAWGVLASSAAAVAALMVGGSYLGYVMVAEGSTLVHDLLSANRPVHQARVRYGGRHVLVRVLGKHLSSARLQPDYENREIEIHVPAVWGGFGSERFGHDVTDPLLLRGNDAVAVMGRAMVRLNRSGATLRDVEMALLDIERAGSPHDLLLQTAHSRPFSPSNAMLRPTGKRSSASFAFRSAEQKMQLRYMGFPFAVRAAADPPEARPGAGRRWRRSPRPAATSPAVCRRASSRGRCSGSARGCGCRGTGVRHPPPPPTAPPGAPGST